MTVNLSALAGAGQQFFDNKGKPLMGGKLYSYAAGTTTPYATYTSASGATAHTNPIVLDSAGRVATGEIWVTAGENYKFVLKTPAEVTIATWDNITGISGADMTAEFVEYDPPFTGALTSGYTVEDKLAQTVSAKDFGAVGDGTTDDTSAIQAAINSRSVAFILDLCGFTYKLLSSLAVTNPITIRNGTLDVTGIDNVGYQAAGIDLISANNVVIESVTFIGNANSLSSKSAHGVSIDRNGGTGSSNITIRNCVFDGIGSFGITSNLIHGSKNWSIISNTFLLYGANNQHPGVAGGIDLFSDQNIATAYNIGSSISGNKFVVTTGYGGTAYKVQGCVDVVISDNHVSGGTVVDYSSAMVEVYATGQFIGNTITAGTNIRSFASAGSPYLDVRNCFFINAVRTDVNARAGGISNGLVNFYNTSVAKTTKDSDFLNGGVKLSNCVFDNIIVQAVTFFSVEKTDIGVLNIRGGGTVPEVSLFSSSLADIVINAGTAVAPLNIKKCDIAKFYTGTRTVTGFNIDETTILDFEDTSASFKTIRNCQLSVTAGNFKSVKIANAFCTGNTFYGHTLAVLGTYIVTLSANATLINNKYTYRDMNGIAGGTYTGQIAIPSTTANTVNVLETPSSFLDGVGQYTVFDAAANQASNMVVAAPTTGTFTRGQIAYNTQPSAAGVPGWVCVASGTPGTWKAMAALAA